MAFIQLHDARVLDNGHEDKTAEHRGPASEAIHFRGRSSDD